MQKIQENMNEVIEAIKNPVPGLPIGLRQVDKVTGGMKAGQLIIYAGRASMGKTSLMCDTLLAQDPSTKVLIFSLEMSNVVLIQRLIASRANINFRTLVDNKCTAEERVRAREAMKYLNTTEWYIDDTPCLTPSQYRDKCEQHPDARLIFVDHLHLMRHDDGRLGEVQALDDISRQVREYAKETQIPTVLLCQLNRQAEQRDTHEPKLSDLRGSGALEQNPDIVLLLYRPAYYMQREIDPNSPDDGESEIIVAKQRNGETGSCKCVYIGEYMSFRDMPKGAMADWR